MVVKSDFISAQIADSALKIELLCDKIIGKCSNIGFPDCTGRRQYGKIS